MPFCSALSNHVAIRLADQTWKPCCRFADTETFKVSEYSIADYKSTPYFEKIINDMENGWHSGCLKCKQEELIGKKSYREKLNKGSSQIDFLEYLEISLSNECNLACRMCSPQYSTHWSKLLANNSELLEYRQPDDDITIDMKKIFQQIDLKHLNRIKYLGGEPFITKQIGQLFKFLNDNNVLQNLTLYIDTNATLFPEKYLHFLRKFKHVNLSISVDGVGKLAKYIREGKSWSVVHKNICKWSLYAQANPNISISLSTTLQAYNIHQLSEIKSVADFFGFDHDVHKLSFPPELSIDCLPQSYLQSIADSTNKSWILTIKDNGLFDKFKAYTLVMDKATNKSINDYIPELASHLTP